MRNRRSNRRADYVHAVTPNPAAPSPAPAPIAPELLPELLTGLCLAAVGTGRLRVVLDGLAAAGPGRLADALVAPLRAAGVRAARVSAGDFLRPAALRFEYGRTDPDALLDRWLDTGALTREVLRPWETGDGPRRWLPALWDPVTDRSVRAPSQDVPAGPAVLLLDGALLLGRGLPLDLTVHLHLSRSARARALGPDEAWALPAYARYDDEAAPLDRADVVIRMDHPTRPAVTVRSSTDPTAADER
jgi:hypothetical protein